MKSNLDFFYYNANECKRTESECFVPQADLNEHRRFCDESQLPLFESDTFLVSWFQSSLQPRHYSIAYLSSSRSNGAEPDLT
jgi:hypothetical protein